MSRPFPTDTQRRCIIDATIADLREFPRGFAATRQGPFHARQTVRGLLRRGAIRRHSPLLPHRYTALARPTNG